MDRKPNRWLPRSRKWRGVLILVIVLGVWVLIAWAAACALIVRASLPVADAIVVLSGSAAYKERARLAAKLYHDGRAPRLILTNDNQRGSWSASEQRNPYYYERTLNELLASGVPRERIEILQQPVLSTYDEAVLLRDYTRAKDAHNILVVTSAYHSRRALWTFVHVFKDQKVQIGLEPVRTGFETPSSATWWLFPSGWRMVFGEYLKIILYRIKYA